MPTAGDMLPPGMTDLARQVKALQRDVRELRAARRAEATRITNGTFSVQSPTGAGLITASLDATSGRYQTGLARDDGTTALAVSQAALDESDTVQLRSRSGQRLVSDDAHADEWLGRPWIPVPMHSAVNFTAAGWTTTHMGLWLAQHRVLHLQAYLSAPASTTAQIQFTGSVGADGAVSTLGPVLTVNDGEDLLYYRATAADLGLVQYGDQITITLDAQRTAGAGTCTATCIGVWGSEAYTAAET